MVRGLISILITSYLKLLQNNYGGLIQLQVESKMDQSGEKWLNVE